MAKYGKLFKITVILIRLNIENPLEGMEKKFLNT